MTTERISSYLVIDETHVPAAMTVVSARSRLHAATEYLAAHDVPEVTVYTLPSHAVEPSTFRRQEFTETRIVTVSGTNE